MAVKWFAKGAGILKAGPFDDPVRAAAAMELVGGGKPDDFAIWPEEVPDEDTFGGVIGSEEEE